MRSLFRGRASVGLALLSVLTVAGVTAPAATAAADPVAAPQVVPTSAPAAAAPTTPAVPPTSATGVPSSRRTVPLVAHAVAGGSFSLVGVTWDRASGITASFDVRTRADKGWSAWSRLDATDLAPDRGTTEGRSTRAATEPLWTGPATVVQVRPAPGSPRVSDVKIELIDPGTTPADAALPESSTDASSSGTRSRTAPSALATRAPGVPPTIVSRAGWGADERLRTANPGCTTPEYGTTVRMGFVHHTDNANTYTSSQSAAIVRSIYTYHVRSNGWCDLGYNFLVDRFGRIFEGRAGGVNLPVVGAHTGGFNRDTFAASMIGNFASVAPPAATMNAMADLFAWKLGSYYRDPQGRTVLTAAASPGSGVRWPPGTRVTLNTISGHRDANATSCPGNSAYALIPALRSMVSSRYPNSPIGNAWNFFGREKSGVGEPTVGERAVAGGLVTGFASGAMTSSAATGVRVLTTTGNKYLAMGGPTSVLGFPTANEGPTVTAGGRSAKLQRGDLYFSPASGAHEVHGDIGKLFGLLGADRSPLGFPTTDETVRLDGKGRSNGFRNGTIYWFPTIGAREVHGLIATTYARLGGERSVLGYPTSNEQVRPDGVGRVNSFQLGAIYWTPATGAREVHGAIQQRWVALGSETNLGYPTSDETVTADGLGRVNTFQRGSIYWSRATGAREVRGAIRDTYVSLGADAGYLGYPTGYERVVSPGVVATDFQHGTITWDTVGGTVTATPDPNPTTSPTPSPSVSPSASPTPEVDPS